MNNILLIFVFLVLSGCATKSIELTNKLEPGMSIKEVKNVLGEPEAAYMTDKAYVMKYTLQKAWTGNIPHYFYFHKDSNKLAIWRADMKEFRRNQQALQSLSNSMSTIESNRNSRQPSSYSQTPNFNLQPVKVDNVMDYKYQPIDDGSQNIKCRTTKSYDGSYESICK